MTELAAESVGNLALILSEQTVRTEPTALARCMSQLHLLVRQNWASPPAHGARIVATVLNNGALSTEWRACLQQMAARIHRMRNMLYERLRTLGTPGDWKLLVAQTGLFSYTSLTRIHFDMYLLFR